MKQITRRSALCSAVGACLVSPVLAAVRDRGFEKAVEVLSQSVACGQVRAASLFVQCGATRLSHVFGDAKTPDATFLLGSISKPVAIAALMTLFDKGKFELDDAAQKYLPEFKGGSRSKVTVRHLLTHTSGLPDQLPQNAELRSSHATLADFVNGAMEVPLHFEPGVKYEYSSMAILLAAEIAQRISGVDIKQFVEQAVLQPLNMQHSALGVGRLKADQVMPCQVEFGAVESGGGSVDSKNWDWNSAFWRQLGAPWGGQHASAPDVGSFLHEFLHPTGKLFKSEVAELMIRNHNATGIESRGLGFDVGMQSSCPGCSPSTFGHTGSTGTIAWSDPGRDLTCVVLTTLPSGAVPDGKHPRQLASDCIAAM
jgi:CubicO group peptidase (beta-lactamase class C family)